jgi:branched-chain amino acid transport system ATP-binding protein
MSALLEVRNVTMRFGGLVAVSDLTLEVTQGHAHGIIGPNGAGKTTAFNVITGIYTPTAGDVLFRGETISGRRPSAIARGGIARTFQNIRLFRDLTVLDNVRIAHDAHARYSWAGAMVQLPSARRAEQESIERCTDLLEKFGLGDAAYERAGDLPYGSQRRLEIARAMALQPSLLLLDEPAAGMNSAETLKLVEFLGWLRDHFSVTMLLIEHHMQLVMTFCDRITVLDFGATIAEGTADEVRNNPKVIEAYLGQEDGHE